MLHVHTQVYQLIFTTLRNQTNWHSKN